MIIKLFRESGEPNFIKWLDKQEELQVASFDFKKQLKAGKKGELLFMEKHGDLLEHICDSDDMEKVKGVDFKLKACGSLVELKSDTYDMDKTPNLFIERWSDHNTEKPGGPWQAKEKGAKYFVYQFTKNDAIFWYDIDKLLEILENHLAEKKVGFVFIKNRGWTTSGYKIRRDLVEGALIDTEDLLHGKN